MANGAFALFSNTTGASNTAIGSQALFSNTEGGLNTADGRRGLFMNITGSRNTATGFGALSSNTEGDDNTAIGVNALLFNVSGDNNAALGRSAGSDINVSGNVCIGQGVSGEAGVDDSTYIRNVNTTEQSPAEDVAYVTVRLSDGRLGHQPTVMRSASSELQKTAEELKSTVAREEATIAQLKNAMEVLTAQFKEHPRVKSKRERAGRDEQAGSTNGPEQPVKQPGSLRHVSGSTKSKFATYSISAVILPLTSFNVTVSTPASFT